MSEPAKHPAPWKWCEGEDEHDELQDLNGFEENALVDATGKIILRGVGYDFEPARVEAAENIKELLVMLPELLQELQAVLQVRYYGASDMVDQLSRAWVVWDKAKRLIECSGQS
jgi:hypothetical protein